MRRNKSGERFDEPWLLDSEGVLTDDPAVLFTDPPGSILPIGGTSYGHKGYGLSLMVEALTAGLAGFGRADEVAGWGATVHLTVYNPAAFAGAEAFLRQVDWLEQACLDNPPRPGTQGVRLPGQEGTEKRTAQLEHGLNLHPSIAPALKADCERYAIAFPQGI